jgi:hypothetical protein
VSASAATVRISLPQGSALSSITVHRQGGSAPMGGFSAGPQVSIRSGEVATECTLVAAVGAPPRAGFAASRLVCGVGMAAAAEGPSPQILLGLPPVAGTGGAGGRLVVTTCGVDSAGGIGLLPNATLWVEAP